MRVWFFSVFLIAAVLATPAMGQMVCKDRVELVTRLLEKYGEVKQADGLTEAGQLVEIFAGESGSWTIIISDPSGMSCVASAGKTWRSGLFANGGFKPKT